jgi:hypothetical protein
MGLSGAQFGELLERNGFPWMMQITDSTTKQLCGGFPSVPTGRRSFFNAFPGLRFACPGLITILPPGENTPAGNSPTRFIQRNFIQRGAAMPAGD